MAGWEEPGAKSDSGPISRVNKLKRDKQEMRKLLRVLLVWGKNFQKKHNNFLRKKRTIKEKMNLMNLKLMMKMKELQ